MGKVTENIFQSTVIKQIKKMLPGCIVLKNDPNYIQGIPDLLILYKSHWAALEVKRSIKATHRPNQDFWVNVMNNMSFAEFIYPENKRRVLDAMCKYLGV